MPPSRRMGIVPARLGLLALGVAAMALGCSRSSYREAADRQSYRIEAERMVAPAWRIPSRPVEAWPSSRIGDPSHPDKSPIPFDDPAARLFQVTAGRKHEFHGWKKRGFTGIEDPRWAALLPRDKDGRVVLGRDSLLRIALKNSREYQTEVEDVYLAALALTLARFEFQAQGFAGNRTFFNFSGARSNAISQLLVDNNAGFSQNFYNGAQLLVDFANALVFDLSGDGLTAATSTLLVNASQPLLRGATARIRTQGLSLVERNVLYAVRDFARYRRGFYVDLVGGGGFLGLLQQLQGIRNQERNLVALERNLDEHRALAAAGSISQLQRDQVYQSYQQAQFALAQTRASYEASLDGFRILLGLPPEIATSLDESFLEQFELNSEAFEDLRKRNEDLYFELVRAETPPARPRLVAALRQVIAQLDELEKIRAEALAEWQRWNDRLGDRSDANDDEELTNQRELATRLGPTLRDAKGSIERDRKALRETIARADATSPEDLRVAARDAARKVFRARYADVFTAQAQVRVFLIDLPKVEITTDQAVAMGLAGRLDLMNAQARVTDAWRAVEVNANLLQSDLTLRYQGSLATDPLFRQPFRFDASASSHRIGIEFDAPINRRAERNAYRTSQIEYQRARRAWMSTRDQIVFQLRQDIRQLGVSARQFTIVQQQLIVAARQVEEAEILLQNTTEGDSSVTLFLLEALQGLLDARNQLIGTFIDYETSRLALYRDLDQMDIDATGVWTNEPRTAPRATDRDRNQSGDGAPGGDADGDPDAEGEGELPPLAPARVPAGAGAGGGRGRRLRPVHARRQCRRR